MIDESDGVATWMWRRLGDWTSSWASASSGAAGRATGAEDETLADGGVERRVIDAETFDESYFGVGEDSGWADSFDGGRLAILSLEIPA